MIANRATIAVAALATIAIAIAVATTSFAAPPRAAGPSDDYALRHPAEIPAALANTGAFYMGSDYAQRHPELSQPANSVDTSDYFLRHPEWLVTDTSDYFLRHAGWTTMPAVIDTSDYFLRHPEFKGP